MHSQKYDVCSIYFFNTEVVCGLGAGFRAVGSNSLDTASNQEPYSPLLPCENARSQTYSHCLAQPWLANLLWRGWLGFRKRNMWQCERVKGGPKGLHCPTVYGGTVARNWNIIILECQSRLCWCPWFGGLTADTKCDSVAFLIKCDNSVGPLRWGGVFPASWKIGRFVAAGAASAAKVRCVPALEQLPSALTF